MDEWEQVKPRFEEYPDPSGGVVIRALVDGVPDDAELKEMSVEQLNTLVRKLDVYIERFVAVPDNDAAKVAADLMVEALFDKAGRRVLNALRAASARDQILTEGRQFLAESNARWARISGKPVDQDATES